MEVPSVPPFLYAAICGALVEASGATALGRPHAPSAAADQAVMSAAARSSSGSAAADAADALRRLRHRKSTNDAWLAGRIEERVVLEKPFGKDHDTCQQLMGEIGALVSPLS